jgi:hypothetical protein
LRTGDIEQRRREDLLCKQGTLIGFDDGSSEGGFNDGTVSQPGGPGTLPFIVTRNTLDGLFQLRQTINWNPAQRSSSTCR